MGRFWQGVAAVCALLAVAGLLTANHYRKLYLARPVIPTAPLVNPPDTTTTRPDTVKVIDPATIARISALQSRVDDFMADSTRGLDSCVALLAEADRVIGGLKAELSRPPEVSLTLSDSTLPYLWPTVHYQGIGTTGISQWGYRFFADKWPREAKPPGRAIGRLGIGGGASFVNPVNGRAGVRLRVKQNLILGADKNLGRPGWGFDLTYFLL